MPVANGSPKVAVGEMGDAVAALEAGRAVVIPTDTVYGLAALPGIAAGVKELFRLKGRAEDKPVAILAAAVAGVAGIGVMDERARRLATRFWPGPLTMVIPRAPGFDVDLGVGFGVAVRVPDSAPALNLLGLAGPLAVTSANRSGAAPATTLEEARSTFGDDVRVYVDGGTCSGTPSTVVSLLGDEAGVLRPGPISEHDISDTLAG